MDANQVEVEEINNLFEIDNYLRPFENEIRRRHGVLRSWIDKIDKLEGGMNTFTKGHEYYGLQFQTDNSVIAREWAPGAQNVYLTGDFNFFKTPLPPTTTNIKYHQQQQQQQKTHSQPLPLPKHNCHAALTNPLFPTQSQIHTTTSSMSSSLYKNTPILSPPKIQYVQRASSNNNNLDWKCNNSQELHYGPQMNNLSIRRHSYVNEYTEFVIKNCSVQTIKSCTKIDQYASSKINRRSSSSNTNTNNNNSSSSSNNSNNNQLNQLPSSSTIICNNRRKIKTSNNSSNNVNNKITSNLLNGKKLITSTATTPNVTTSAIINNCNSNSNNNNNNEIISLNSRNMQVLLKRCKSAAAATTTTANNNNNQFLTQTLTLPGRGIVLKQHNQPDTYVIEDQIEPEEDEDELEQQKDEVEQRDAAMHLSRTAQILRKFRIPKTTALLPKMVAANNKCLINTDDLSCRSVLTVAAPTPPPTVGTPNSTASSGVGYLEEVIEGVDEDDMQDDTETVIIEESLPKSEMLDESDEYLTDENYLTEDGLISNLDNVSGNTVIMSNNNAGSTAPLQLQTLQPNGAITCINLPPNTILLSAADGTILATTAPASNSNNNNKLQSGEQTSQQQQQQQQQQLIALQDWSGNGGNVGMLPQNGTTTMLLTSDGNAIPILQQSMAAAAAANELLKTQVLA